MSSSRQSILVASSTSSQQQQAAAKRTSRLVSISDAGKDGLSADSGGGGAAGVASSETPLQGIMSSSGAGSGDISGQNKKHRSSSAAAAGIKFSSVVHERFDHMMLTQLLMIRSARDEDERVANLTNRGILLPPPPPSSPSLEPQPHPQPFSQTASHGGGGGDIGELDAVDPCNATTVFSPPAASSSQQAHTDGPSQGHRGSEGVVIADSKESSGTRSVFLAPSPTAASGKGQLGGGGFSFAAFVRDVHANRDVVARGPSAEAELLEQLYKAEMDFADALLKSARKRAFKAVAAQKQQQQQDQD
jgi:hypothetical protein